MATLNPAEAARVFCEEQQAFRLGSLTTERPHPLTRDLSDVADRDLAAAIRLLQCVDHDLPPVMLQALSSGAYVKLVEAVRRVMREGGRVFISGCGATGRLAILLEACWRRGVAELSADHPEAARWEHSVRSVMAGGDFALIKSVEGFEDFAEFGRRQIAAAGLTGGDVVIAITEGGETPFVIGTAWEGIGLGAEVFFVFNNPALELREHVARSRELLDKPRVTAIDLATGPMAVAGSTRMQATTIELAVVGAALEDALCAELGLATPSASQRVNDFAALLDRLEREVTVQAIAELARLEAEVYAEGGRVLYLADRLLLDVLTDTTERSPTFSLPPFRSQSDTTSAASWSFVKDPRRGTAEAWRSMLERPLRGLSWSETDYRAMGAPASIVAHPPQLNVGAIEAFAIGQDVQPESEEAPYALSLALYSPDDAADFDSPHDVGVYLNTSAGTPTCRRAVCLHLQIRPSPLRLETHLAAKLVLNSLSTATMAKLGRLSGNWMLHVRTSNKKLIDRGVRLIADRLGLGYESACVELFRAIEAVRQLPAEMSHTSPVAWAVAHHSMASTPRKGTLGAAKHS